MGKSAPKPPPAPDPSAVAAAQASSNENTALFQSTLNNTNQVTPFGNVTYNLGPGGQWTETTTLSPAEQAIFSGETSAAAGALGTANQQLGRVTQALGQGLQAPTLQTGADTGNLASGYASGGAIDYGFTPGGPVATRFSPGGPIQPQVAPTYSPFAGLTGDQSAGPGTAPAPAGGQGPGAQAYSPANPPPGMHYDQSSGWIPTTPYGVDTTGAHPGDMYSPTQGWIPATSQAVYPQGHGPSAAVSAASPATPAPAAQAAPGLQTVPSAQAGASGGFPALPGGLGDPNHGSSTGLAAMMANPVLGAQMATYGEALQQLDPQWGQAGEQQQAQLVAQGLNPDDAAYQNAMDTFNLAKNDAYDQALFNAINSGEAEQNTLFGQNLSAGQFANAAQQEGYNENLGQAQFANQAQAQQYGENQGLAQFNNAAQAQANSQAAQAAAFYNAALGQNWQENYQNAQLANQAVQQRFQDQAYAQELPINELNALISSGQVQAPASAPAQTSVAPTNVLGAYQLQQNALQNNYNAQMQNYSSGMGGLFNLGAAALKTFLP